MGENKTVKAVITFMDGSELRMMFAGWEEYVKYLEEHYGEIEETSGGLV